MMKQRFLSVLLALTMLLSLMPASVFAAEGKEQTVSAEAEVTLTEEERAKYDASLEDYFKLTLIGMDGGATFSTGNNTAGSKLTDDDLKVYTAVKEKLTGENGIAAKGGYTEFAVSGVTSANVDMRKVYSALCADFPYEMYWRGLSYGSATVGETYYFYLQVSENYQAGAEDTVDHTKAPLAGIIFKHTDNTESELDHSLYYVSPSKAAAAAGKITASTGNVQKILSRAGSMSSDFEKLNYFKKSICDQVTYNHTAADDKKTPYGDPWQLIYVFDDDPDTNVVCEGYSKAFQYLCDLTTFSGTVQCYSVSGKMNTGNHMWNIVTIGGNNYMADITNSDAGAFGAGGGLFLSGAAGSISGGYTFLSVPYVYDTDTTTLFGTDDTSILKLASTDYTAEGAPASIEITLTPATEDTSATPRVYFLVPTLAELGSNSVKTVTLTAVAKNAEGQEISGAAFDWTLSGTSDKGISLTYDSGSSNTATLTISSTALSGYDPTSGGLGPAVTVTASSSTTNQSSKFSIYMRHRNAASVKVLKNGSEITTETISAGGTTTYTAEVYDQFGVKMEERDVISDVQNNQSVTTKQTVPTVNWSVTGGTGVTVNNGTVTVDANATAGTYNVTASVGSATATVTVTVSASTPEHTHNWKSEWTHNDTHHWHECTDSNCPETDNSKKGDYDEHSWGAGVETKAPTCTENGEVTYTCSVCKATKKDTIVTTGHKWATEWSKDETNHWHACTNTGCSEKKDDAAHTWTLSADKTKYTCTCGKEKAHTHTWDAGTVTKAPTCTEKGVRTFTCTDSECGATRTEEIAATGHKWATEWSTDDDYHWHNCGNANCPVTDNSQKNGYAAHSWGEGSVTTEPTETTEGVKTYTCTVCSQTKTETIGVLGHEYSTDWSKDSDYHWHACTEHTDCGKVSNKAAHSWNTGEVTTAPTFEADGVKTYTCSVCGQTKTETVPKKEHTYSSEWSKDEANHWHACTDTGYTDLVKDKAAHVYDNDADTTCNTCGYTRTVTQTFTVTLNANGGTVGAASLTTNGEGKLTSLPTPTRSGYTFNGWFTAASGGTRVTTATVFTENTTVYAHWTANSGGSSSGGSSSGGGGGGSSSSGSSGTTTKNPDGTTTTTTKRPDGTTVETTNRKDGTKEVVETKKDGTVVTTETKKNGDKVVTTENRDGSVQEVVTNRDGSSAKVTTSASGSVEADVTVKPVKGTATAPISPVRVGRGEVVVTIKTGASDSTRVQVPVSNISSGVVALLVKADGTQEIIKTSLPTEDGLLVPVKDGETVRIENRAKEFRDMGNTAWAQSAVDFVSARGMFAGTTGSTFSPNSTLTRAQMVTVLARYEGVDTNGGSTWYEKGVQWAKDNGVSDGAGLERQISREQMVAMLWRVAGRPEPQNPSGLQGFSDAGSVAEYARSAMAWAIENGIIFGVSGSRISPQGTATRAQAAAVLTRFVQNIDAEK